MKLGYIGLGKMGKNMVLRLLGQGHELVAYNRSIKKTEEVVKKGAKRAESVEELVEMVKAPRLVWVMLPSGDVVEKMTMRLLGLLNQGDVVVDGGNSNYKETVRRSKMFAEKGIALIDAGVSGGPDGARTGACVMVGGEREVYERIEPLIKSIAADNAYGYFGKSGAGHFVKMVHNGIEYGMMQAIGEGFELLKKSDFGLDLSEVTRVYNEKSVIESRLIGWLKRAYEQGGKDLEKISGSVSHSGEGLWTVEEAKRIGVPVPVIEAALQFRIDSQKSPSYTGKVVSALRNQFGGHEVKKQD